MQAHVSTDDFSTDVYKGVAQMSVCPQSGEKRIGGWKALSGNCSAFMRRTVQEGDHKRKHLWGKILQRLDAHRTQDRITNTNTPDIDQVGQEFLQKQKQIPKNEKQ